VMYDLIINSGLGNALPAAGTHNYLSGTTLQCFITNAPLYEGVLQTQYIVTGWTRSGSSPSSGGSTNTDEFVITNDTTVTWHWQTNYYLDTETEGQGLVNFGDGWYFNGSSVVLEAYPSNYWSFAGWSGATDGCPFADNVCTAVMVKSRAITAAFSADLAPRDTPEWWLALHKLTNGGLSFAQAELADDDGDKVIAADEWIADTIPTNADSYLRFTEMIPPAPGLVMKHAGGTQAWRFVEYSVDLDDWYFLGSNAPPTRVTNSLGIGPALPRMYFRVRAHR